MQTSPPGLAALIAEFIERLQLRDVTVVGNDIGGALDQILCANHPDIVDRLVPSNCDAFEYFPPGVFRFIEEAGARIPAAIAGPDVVLRIRPMRRAMLTAAPLTVGRLPDELLAAWIASLHDPDVRNDLRAVLQGISLVRGAVATDCLRSATPNDSLGHCPVLASN